MNKLHVSKFALGLGLFVAFMHLLWGLAVATGLGQLYIDFIFGLHMISNPFVVGPFSLITAIELIIVAFIVAYIVGAIFAWIWNKFVVRG